MTCEEKDILVASMLQRPNHVSLSEIVACGRHTRTCPDCKAKMDKTLEGMDQKQLDICHIFAKLGAVKAKKDKEIMEIYGA